MTTPFYGFPKANSGVMPEAAKFYKAVVLFTGGNVSGPIDSSVMCWLTREQWRSNSSTRAYILTDIPIGD